MPERRFEVQRAIAASPSKIFAVLIDPRGHVEIDASGMLMSATEPPVTAVGDRFDIEMDRDSLRDFDLGEYRVTVVIETFIQDQEIAWSIDGVTQPPIGHIYGYRLQETDGGTLVSSYYDWANTHPAHDELVNENFPIISETHLLATLGILARTVAPGKSRPGAHRSN
ncbi:MAG TPA: polyketide cyclase [Acidimicrobiaceae bacterium]|nr:polyketide cyclase [Actinomycetota bacterium]HAN07867.1 polyketide cyclase [Acidimicrobiaceae bacterium]